MNSYILVNLEKRVSTIRKHVYTTEFHFLIPCKYEKELMKILINKNDNEISEWFKTKDFDELFDLDWDSGFVVTKQIYEEIDLTIPSSDF